MALDYFDKLAEASVKDAIQQLVVSGKRPSSRTVPPEARQLLRQKGRGRLTEADAEKRVRQAVERLKERKEIKAPHAPNNDWALIGQGSQAAAES
jgi:hypothetical protein